MTISPAIETEAKALLDIHGLDPTGLTAADGFANTVMISDNAVIRLNDGRFRDAFKHEATVLSKLPENLLRPIVLGNGARKTNGEYLIVERLPGQNLAQAWPTLSSRQKDHIIVQIAHYLRDMHHLSREPWMTNSWCDDAISNERWRDAYHAPAHVVQKMIADAHAKQPQLDPLLTELDLFVEDRAGSMVDHPCGFTHTDLHFRNLMVFKGQLTGVLDFEGSRFGPLDIELDMLRRSILGDAQISTGDKRLIFQRIRDEHPRLFSHPLLLERLEIYEAQWHLIQMYHWKPGDTWTVNPATGLRMLMEGQLRDQFNQLGIN